MHLTSQNSSPNQQRTPQVIGVMQSQNNNTGNRGPRPLEQVTCYKVIQRGGRRGGKGEGARFKKYRVHVTWTTSCCFPAGCLSRAKERGVLVLQKVFSLCKQVHEMCALLNRYCVLVRGYCCGNWHWVLRPLGCWFASSWTCCDKAVVGQTSLVC